MPAIGGIGRGSGPNGTRESVTWEQRGLGAPSGTGGALVPVAPSDGRRESPRRPAPGFLAHLAATRGHAPQTRAIRRAEPAEAVAAYGAMLVMPVATGRVFRRSV